MSPPRSIVTVPAERPERDRVDGNAGLLRQPGALVRLRARRVSGSRRRGGRPLRGAARGRSAPRRPIRRRRGCSHPSTAGRARRPVRPRRRSPCRIRASARRSLSSDRLRSVVGARHDERGRPRTRSSPILTCSGTESANDVIAARAASSRVGATSVAFIETETSTTSTTVARSDVAASGSLGRATATQSSAIVHEQQPGHEVTPPARAARDRGEHRQVRERRSPRAAASAASQT